MMRDFNIRLFSKNDSGGNKPSDKSAKPYWQEMLEEIIEITDYNLSSLSREIGISRITLRNILNGHVKMPSNLTFTRLARFYFQHCYDNDGNKIKKTK